MYNVLSAIRIFVVVAIYLITFFIWTKFCFTSLEEFPPIHYVLIYKIINVYYLSKSHDILKKSFD